MCHQVKHHATLIPCLRRDEHEIEMCSRKSVRLITSRVLRCRREEREMVQRLTLRNQELSARMAGAATEKAELVLDLEQARDDADRADEALHDNNRKVMIIIMITGQGRGAYDNAVR
jgi:hypothetical protein